MGEKVKCTINIASAIESTNSMINVILKAVNKCHDLHTHNKKCGMSASKLTENTAGLTASIAGVYEKCQKDVINAVPAVAPHAGGIPGAPYWAHGDAAQCVVDVKDTVKNLFKVIKAFMKLENNCPHGGAPSKDC